MSAVLEKFIFTNNASIVVLGEPQPALLRPLLDLFTNTDTRIIVPASSPGLYTSMTRHSFVVVRIHPRLGRQSSAMHLMNTLHRAACLLDSLRGTQRGPIQYGGYPNFTPEPLGYVPLSTLSEPSFSSMPVDTLPTPTFALIIHFSRTLKDAILATSVGGMFIEASGDGHVVHIPLKESEKLDRFVTTSSVNTKVLSLADLVAHGDRRNPHEGKGKRKMSETELEKEARRERRTRKATSMPHAPLREHVHATSHARSASESTCHFIPQQHFAAPPARESNRSLTSSGTRNSSSSRTVPPSPKPLPPPPRPPRSSSRPQTRTQTRKTEPATTATTRGAGLARTRRPHCRFWLKYMDHGLRQ